MEYVALRERPALAEPSARASGEAQVLPLHRWWSAIAAALIPISLLWDFSWESTIGVDRFWSPPHLATQAGIWLAGLLGARLVLAFTVARQRGSAGGVSVGPLRGPTGAWVLLWSAAELETAFLFDAWWQRAYGLGAGLWHPPQLLKAAGFFGLLFGALMLTASPRPRSTAATPAARWQLSWQGGLLVSMGALVLTMASYPNLQHTASFYLRACALYPALLLAAGRARRQRWGATRTALAYMAVVCVLVWLLPLIPARPLTAPIHNPMDRMMPPPFPLLLAAPALVLDMIAAFWRTAAIHARSAEFPTSRSRRLLMEALRAGTSGLGFAAAFVPAQWYFSKFLLSPASDNWWFAGGGVHWPFFLKIDQARVMFWGVEQDPLTWRAAGWALLLAVTSAWVGLRVAGWLTKLRR